MIDAQVAQEILNDPNDDTSLSLIYANVNGALALQLQRLRCAEISSMQASGCSMSTLHPRAVLLRCRSPSLPCPPYPLSCYSRPAVLQRTTFCCAASWTTWRSGTPTSSELR